MTKEITFTRTAYTVAEWAKACGLGETTVREHIKAGKLVTVYPVASKQLVTLEDGLAWLRSLPSESTPR